MNQDFSNYQSSFLQQLDTTQIDAITSTPLVKKYLEDVLRQKEYYTKIYAFVLKSVLQKTNKNIAEISLLDFGCGNGLLALFARHCGIGKVYGCDFNKDFIEAASILSKQLNLEIDWLVCSENELYNSCKSLNLDIIIGTDVIEHIYNLNVFYKNIYLLNKAMITGFTTASVHDNYFKRRGLYKLMIQDETVCSNAFDATSKDEYAGLAYLDIRTKLIASTYPQLQQNTVLELATATRGLRVDDINLFVEDYLKTGFLIKDVKANRFNTCDPITGNFTERVLQVNEYQLLYAQNNFNLEVISGFYSAKGRGIKSFCQKAFNIFINLFKHHFISRTIAPFILLVGVPAHKEPH